MHETSLLTQSPQRSRSKFVGCALRSNLNDSITRTNIVQQEVSKRMDDFVPQSIWNCKCATIHSRSGGSRDNRFHMAGAAAELAKKMVTDLGGRSCSKRHISRGNHGSPYELSEVDVSQAKVIRLIFGVLRSLENCGDVFRAQPVRDSHLVEIGVGNKGEQAAVLILPPEASDAGLSRSLENRRLDHFPVNSSIA